METITEKRNHQRHEHNSPMNLYRMDHQDQHYYAEMNDYSQGGLSMMTNEKLVVNQIVFLEMRGSDNPVPDPRIIKNNSGIVRWAKSYPSTNGGTNGLYKYGVEYSKPIQTNLN